MIQRHTFWRLAIPSIILFWIMLIWAVCAHAVGRPNPPMVYYMDSVSGNDNNPGTFAAPWETPAASNRTTLWPGDSVLRKRGGRYGACQRDTTDTVSSSGNADSLIVFGAYGEGEMPVVTAARHITGWDSVGVNKYARVKAVPDSTFALWVRNVLGTRVMTQAALDANREWLTTADSTYVFLTAAADIAFIDRSKTFALTLNGKNYLYVRDTRFTHGMGPAGSRNTAHASGTYNTITRCVIDSSAAYGVQFAGKNSTISNSLLRNNQDSPIMIMVDSLRIYNNTIVGGASGISHFYFNGANLKNTIIRNNISVDPTYAFVRFDGAGTTCIASHNLFYKTNGVYTNMWKDNATNYSTLAAWQAATSQEANSIVADPMFRDAANGDYRLKPGSPARLLGVNLWSAGVRADFAGVPYPNAVNVPYSAGAYHLRLNRNMNAIGNDISNEITNVIQNW